MSDAPSTLDIPADLVRFERPLFHLRKQIDSGGPVRIVAIGSSSTFGEGNIPPYPARLKTALKARYPGRDIDVLNKGVNGEEAPDEFRRFAQHVIGQTPVLTIWQAGTNAIFHDDIYNVNDVAMAIDAGLRWLSGLPMDVVLMDLQYAPVILTPGRLAATERMVESIGEAARKAGVNVFRRFALMRHWVKDDNIPIDRLIDPIDPNHLHQSELCTAGVTQALDILIADAVKRANPAVAIA